ncbi:hypothetical protein LTR84_006191 [Exophiala bonariae]|uniref:Copper-fist domain-containing protein n=1 Tax=Exophiala bonariae TaxID=1690606 RepID=A0AAV9N509_9EURO|nr:hypothetical protein LTR84_006191 [Exophiala bonariae]
MPTGWLEEDFNSSPPYSPQYSPSQMEPELQSKEDGVADQFGSKPMPISSNWPVGMPLSPTSQYTSESTRTAVVAAVNAHEGKSRAALTRVYSSTSVLDARECDTDSGLPQASSLPRVVSLGITCRVESDLDSLFGDSDGGSGLIEDSKASELSETHSYEPDIALFANPTYGGIKSAGRRTYPLAIEELARLKFEQDFKRPASQVYASFPSEERNLVTQVGVQDSELVSQLRGDSCFGTQNPFTKQTDLTQNLDEAHGGRNQKADLYEPEIPVTTCSIAKHSDASCQGNLECTCRPTECHSAGCDHSAEIDAMMHLFWQEVIQAPGCGGGGDRSRCACLPGLCHCEDCDEHAHNENPVDRQTADTHSSRNLWPDPPPSPLKWRDVFPGGRKILDDTGNWIIESSSPPIPWKTVQRFDAELPRSLQNISRQERDVAIRGFCASSQLKESHQRHGFTLSKMPGSDIGNVQARSSEMSPCSCSTGAIFTCTPDTCKCDKGISQTKSSEIDIQAAQIANYGLCACACGGGCQCGPSSHHPSTGSIRGPEPMTKFTEPSHAPRRYISVSDLIGVVEDKTSALTAHLFHGYPTQIPPSRPDTPRPHPNSCPSTPYASEVRPNLFEPRLEVDPIRQSVEPEVPFANWQRESTPAYEDRSLTPSPVSRRGDITMFDSPYNRGSVPPLPHVDLSASGTSRSISPPRPPLPPIPSTLPSLKVAKRDERHKSGVQGSKVDKRSVTGLPTKGHNRSKSRNITKKTNNTRQPPSTVGGLVEQRDGLGGAQTPAVDRGRVAAAVASIEAQVHRQQQDKDTKQKDGTPVRRSQRRNKGVRNSLGSEL